VAFGALKMQTPSRKSIRKESLLPGTTEKRHRHRDNFPEHVRQVLRQWLFDHKQYPYPDLKEKLLLCEQTGLSMNQVQNWLTNARRRLLPVAGNARYRKSHSKLLMEDSSLDE